MLLLKPTSLETIWGGKKLHSYGATEITSDTIGQLYTACSDSTADNIILNGMYKGKLLSYLWKNHRDIFGYEKTDIFPLAIALVDASKNLSVQIHPHDEYAQRIEGDQFGKEESWIFLNIPKEKKIINGCKSSSLDEVKENINCSNWEKIIDYLDVEEMSYVHVKPGTLHALTEGSFVYEIQQASNKTYRFYDYDRVDKNNTKRELHLEKALDVLDVNSKSQSVYFSKDKIFEEITYNLWAENLTNNVIENTSSCFRIYTVVNGLYKSEDNEIPQGYSFILLPNEKINIFGTGSIIACEPK